MQFVTPMPFVEAVQKLGGRSPIGSKLNSREWSDAPLALRERAFFSATIENVRFLQRGKDALGDFIASAREEITLPDGTMTTALKTGSRAQFIAQMREFAVKEGMGPLDPKDAGGLKDIRSEQRLGLIFDVQTQSAQQYGDWKQGMDPDVLNEFPAQRFIREVDVKTPRIIHLQNEGVVRLKTDLEWWRGMNSPVIGGFGVPWGPWGFHSGMGVEDVDRDEAETLGLLTADDVVRPIEQDFNDHLKASVKTLSPEMQAWLRKQFGPDVRIENDAAWWKGDRDGKKLAGVAPKPRKKPAPDLPIDPRAFPADPNQVDVVRSLGGSTGAELVRDPRTGQMFVRKIGANAEHLREEMLADQMYQALGAPVPEARLYETATRPVKLARYIDGNHLGEYLKTASPEQRTAVMGKLKEHFAADALLGNWDVAGLNLDNVLVDSTGVPWRIDNGGSLRFRAQGTRKTGEQWNEWPVELWSMRDRTQPAGALFGDLGIFQIGKQIERLDLQRVVALVPAELRDVVQGRVSQMQSLGQKALDYQATRFVPEYADRMTRNIMDVRRSGVLDSMSTELVQGSVGDFVLRDVNGLPFDHLRTQKGDKVGDPSENYFKAIKDAASTISFHHSEGTTEYNVGKLSNAFGLKPHLQKLSSEGDASQKAMADHYLELIAGIEAAQGNPKAAPPWVAKFPLPTAGGAKQSVVAAFADWMSTQGGDWSIINSWASSQSGSSKSDASRALKYYLMEQLDGAKPDDFHHPPTRADFSAIQQSFGPKYQRSFDLFHALVQEVLGRLEFNGNDRTTRMLRLLRTETDPDAVTIPVGQTGEYRRGVNESGSFYTPFSEGARTITAVPHTRITSLYFFERDPGNSGPFLLGDYENEATYIGWGLRTKSLGVLPKGRVPTKTTKNRKDWEI